ncbi:hypothetical protein [Streptomyces sp. NPDC094472]|uniref:hypothetical protein n=1 Tax=Streptomyces sp. NPDC094472 TaxID=3155080 RepID=UPI00332DCE41
MRDERQGRQPGGRRFERGPAAMRGKVDRGGVRGGVWDRLDQLLLNELRSKNRLAGNGR